MERDNKKIAIEICELRAQQAKMHCQPSFGDYQLQDTMAQTPARVMELLERVWVPAKLSAERERLALEQYVATHDPDALGAADGSVEPWDWRYFAEKVRQSRYNFDESELKPYLSLDRMVEAVFACAHKLFGLRFVPRPDILSYHAG